MCSYGMNAPTETLSKRQKDGGDTRGKDLVSNILG